jgi:tripartite-type tricarboxylate transporter receptor subunit TctC
MSHHLKRLLQTSLACGTMACAALLCAPEAAHAGYPEKPIKWVVPFPPGGAMDAIARTLGEHLQRRFGQPVVIENKPGAGGNVGVDAVAKSTPDGYTWVITSIGMTTNRHLYAKLSYDPLKDFTPVTQLAVVPNILVVNPTRVSAMTVAELIAAAKANPGKLTYASAGNGTSIHLAGELFASMAGVDMVHVPYRGSGPAVSDLLGGQVDMMFDSISSARPHVQAGKLRVLGITTAKRAPSLPEVAPIAELGVRGYELVPWFGVFVPAGTPADVVQTLHRALVETMQLPEVKARFDVIGAEVVGNTPAAFAAQLVAESAKWERVIRERKIQAD